MKRRRNPAVLAITAEGFLSRLSFGVVSLALPLYALRLGMSVVAIGVLVSVNVIVQLAVKPVAGVLADRFGHRRMLITAIAARSAVPLLLVFAHAPWQLFAIRTAYGVAQSFRDPPLNAIIAVLGGQRRVASTFAWYHTAKNAAASVGRAFAGLLLAATASNYPAVFVVAFALSLLPLGVVLPFVREPAAPQRTEGCPVPRQQSRADRSRRAPGVLPYTALGFLFGTTAGMLNLFPVLAVKYFGLTAGQIGLILLASTVVMVAAGPTFGWLADEVSRTAVLLFRGLANTLSSLMYLAFPTVWGVGISKTVDDAGKAAFRPAWGSIMAEVARSDPRRRGRTMGMIDLGEDGGDAVGPVIAGLLLSVGGLPLMLGARVGLALATEVFAVVVTRRLDRARKPTAEERVGAHEAPAAVR